MATKRWGNFEWDDRKAASNLEKHGISFQAAATILPGGLLKDAKTVDGQTRFMMIGEPVPPVGKKEGPQDNIWKVIFTLVKDGDRKLYRLISVHPVNMDERRAYLAHKATKEKGGAK